MSNLTTLSSSPYGYVPTKWLCIMFLVLFSATTFLHFVQARRYGIRWLVPTAVVCGILEIIGWSGRYWSSMNPLLLRPFVMQLATTIMAPGYLFIATFIIFVRITKRLGPQFLRLSPTLYTIIFISCGTVALTIQAVGGGLASGSNRQLGSHVALAGLALQLLLMTIYIVLTAEFVIRFNLDKPARNEDISQPRGRMDESTKRMIFAVFVIILLLYIRSIYRVVGLSEGFGGKVVSTQWLFAVFDAGLVFLAMLTLNRFHPGVLLPGPDEPVVGDEKVQGPPETFPMI